MPGRSRSVFPDSASAAVYLPAAWPSAQACGAVSSRASAYRRGTNGAGRDDAPVLPAGARCRRPNCAMPSQPKRSSIFQHGCAAGRAAGGRLLRRCRRSGTVAFDDRRSTCSHPCCRCAAGWRRPGSARRGGRSGPQGRDARPCPARRTRRSACCRRRSLPGRAQAGRSPLACRCRWGGRIRGSGRMPPMKRKYEQGFGFPATARPEGCKRREHPGSGGKNEPAVLNPTTRRRPARPTNRHAPAAGSGCRRHRKRRWGAAGKQVAIQRQGA